MLQLASEVVVSFLIFVVLLWQNVAMTLFIIAIFGVMTLIVLKVLKPRLNKNRGEKSGDSVADCQVENPVHLRVEGCKGAAQGRVLCAQLL